MKWLIVYFWMAGLTQGVGNLDATTPGPMTEADVHKATALIKDKLRADGKENANVVIINWLPLERDTTK